MRQPQGQRLKGCGSMVTGFRVLGQGFGFKVAASRNVAIKVCKCLQPKSLLWAK